MAREPRIYAPAERLDVEVLVDDRWFPGELRAWLLSQDGGWRANVQFRTKPGWTYLTTVNADRVRLAEGDRPEPS
jgi:hypothetical protein